VHQAKLVAIACKSCLRARPNAPNAPRTAENRPVSA
jgi:hypothetical protein